MTLGKRLKDARVERGLTQSAFAKRVKATQAAVSMWESGAIAPHARKLRAISTALDIPVPELLALSFESKRRKKGAA